MTTKEHLDFRHTQAKSALILLSNLKTEKTGFMNMCTVIANKLDITSQTVYNYCKGRTKDGYLADAILKEIKTYKPSKNK